MKKRATQKEKLVKESLIDQLKLQNKAAEFYTNMVDDYMSYWRLKEELIKDINDKGIRYYYINGNGVRTEKPNESVQNLQKTTATMLKILNDLNLREPLMDNSDEDEYL